MTDTGFDFNELFDVEDYLYFYADTLHAEDTPRQIDFLERALAMQPQARVLDVGCGHGRHALELARRGYHVLGFDLVSGFIDHGRRAAEAEGLSADLRVGDARYFDGAGMFDHALCLFDVVGFFDDVGNHALVEAATRALRPGGTLCLDVRNRDWVVRSMLPTTILEKGDDLMIDRHHFDSESGRLIDRRILVRNGVVKRRPFSIRLYSLSEVMALTASMGLEAVGCYGDYREEPISLARNRMVLCFRRRG